MKIIKKDLNGLWDLDVVSDDFDEIYGFCLDICEENEVELKIGIIKIPEPILIQIAKRIKRSSPDNPHGVSVKNELTTWHESIKTMKP